jgi:hypothetical protein
MPLSGATCLDPVTSAKKHLIDLSPTENSHCSVAALSAGGGSIHLHLSYSIIAIPVTILWLVR